MNTRRHGTSVYGLYQHLTSGLFAVGMRAEAFRRRPRQSSERLGSEVSGANSVTLMMSLMPPISGLGLQAIRSRPTCPWHGGEVDGRTLDAIRS